jgi:hypothetical protein
VGAPTEESSALWAPVDGAQLAVWVVVPSGKPLPEGAVVEGVQRPLAGQPEEQALLTVLAGREPPGPVSVIDTSVGLESWRARGDAGSRAPRGHEAALLKHALLALGVIAGLGLAVLGARRARMA